METKTKLAFADDHFHDECGVFGVFGHTEAANLAYLGLYALQHRGQESAGIVSSDGNELHLHRAMGEVEEIFAALKEGRDPAPVEVKKPEGFVGRILDKLRN